jgi:branched-chain amino acid transport system substrate-binding protein
MRRALLPAIAFISALAAACGPGTPPAAAPAGAVPASTTSAAADTSPVYFGLSAPLTGPLAEYGGFFKQGFGLALDEINTAGGVNGRNVELVWEDTQSDPKQSVPVAQKFVDDPRIIAELGDFSSTSSMAASPTYERAKMVQFGYTNSSPDFTKGGNYMFAPGVSQATSEVQQTDALAKYGPRVAVLYLNTSWGNTTYGVFKDEAAKLGLEVTYSASYLDSTTDFRPLLINARDSNPDVVYDIGYDNDASAILNQRSSVELKTKIFVEQLTAAGIKLAGENAEGTTTTNSWFPTSPEPRVQSFSSAFKAKYGNLPGQFEVASYDALYQVVAAARKGGATREGVYNGLKNSTDLPSVQIGPFGFEADRRPKNPPPPATVVVKGGELVLVSAN